MHDDTASTCPLTIESSDRAVGLHDPLQVSKPARHASVPESLLAAAAPALTACPITTTYAVRTAPVLPEMHMPSSAYRASEA